MKVEYDKTEINKVKYSGIFLIFLMILSFYFIVRDREIAVLIVTGPIIVTILKKVMRLFVILRNNIKHKRLYLELKGNTLIYNSVYDGQLCIDLTHIKDIQFNEDGIFLYMNYSIDEEKKKRNNLFKYYIQNNDNMYKIPILGKKEKIEAVFEVIREKLDKDSVKIEDEVQKTANLPGNYIFIIVGIIWSFGFHVLRNDNIQKNIFIMLVLIAGMFFLYKYNKRSLEYDGISCGGVVRCMGCSLTMAQYILCACQIEEIVNKYQINLTLSMKSFGILSFFYLITAILFLPVKGFGKRIILHSLRMQEN